MDPTKPTVDSETPGAYVNEDGLTIIPPELLGIANDDDTGVYDTVEIEDMEFNEELDAFTYPCPCGDRFFISVNDLKAGDEIATCPSCSLRVKVIYDHDDFAEYE
jgi:diphthamide biosynthesis protein 3